MTTESRRWAEQRENEIVRASSASTEKMPAKERRAVSAKKREEDKAFQGSVRN